MKKLYFDMDGVLADFDGMPDAMLRFTKEEGFFQKLEPTILAKRLNAMLEIEAMREAVHILSASPNYRADIDKMFWIYENMPNMKPENVIIVRGGKGADERKAAYADPDSVLFDDYSGNLLSWVAHGGKAVKVINGRNGSGKTWKGDRLVIE